ncbi:hypothetical protein MXMO3_00407 [Maritalea myrionectae]|uniref:Uncharacterized protein n=1 Tax=Maritalea myrionectae TaxID=454601 RepID=A0A2R4MAE5_9HYPH|nr:hypothetical protein [Maritalea myrionectae]AVX02953.1 hypothetical protein MXMO3_00407 [Maritalea myrionectae]
MVEDNKKGPVRPPILDAEAKKSASSSERSTKSQAESEKPKPTDGNPADKKATSAAQESTKSAPQKDSNRKPSEPPKSTAPVDEGSGTGTFIAAIVLSAALGIAGTAGLAYYKVFPFNQWAEQSTLEPEIAKLQKRIFDLENAQEVDLTPFATVDDLGALQSEIEAIDTDRINQAIANIEQQLESISTPADEPTPIDLGPIENALTALEQDVANLKQTQIELAERATANPEVNVPPAAAPTVDLEPLEAQISTQATTLVEFEERIAAQNAQIADLKENLAALRVQIATLEEDQSARQAANSALAAARLPILMSEIDAAINSGQPFATRLQELASVTNATPADDVLVIAQNGLTPANTLKAQFEDLRLQLLAARPGIAADAPWQDKLLGAVKDAVNLRPLDAEGDDPLVLLDEAEAALAAQNLRAAQSHLQKLPPQMQQVATPLIEQINAHLVVEQWQTDMRAALLNQNAPAEGDAQ